MRIAVFLGPTLPLDAARAILPRAWYCDPCGCGDLLRILRLQPDRILLIDGYFSATPAPWHKEFLLALDQGVEVYGASSMGALRAAELARFGMIGVGRIYEDFAAGRLDGDDEVAVTHSDEASGFREMNEALINIRYTLDRAVVLGKVEKSVAAELLERIRSKYFPERSLALAIQEYTEQKGVDLSALRSFLQEGNFVNQKRLDAIEALYRVRDDPPHPPSPPHTNYTRYIRELIRWTSCSAFRKTYEWLPAQEVFLARMAYSDPNLIEGLRGVAEGLMHAIDVVRHEHLWPKKSTGHGSGAEVARELTQGWDQLGNELTLVSSWVIAQSEAIGLNDSVVNITASFLKSVSLGVPRITQLPTSIVTPCRNGSDAPGDPETLLTRAMQTQALLVLCLGSLARSQGLAVKTSILESDLLFFRASHGLETSEALDRFLDVLGVSRTQAVALFFDYLNYRRVYCLNRADPILESRPSPVQFALGDAFACVHASLSRRIAYSAEA